ncbi:MAG: ABC transporter ATP-binding protein/permease [Ruminococcaceae bacterium]|nr:ABC transporter ATP-binding protein/permease [Oscillospiraceae bacterium]
MLELKCIVKHYPIGGSVVEALKGIDLQFRKSEFVSILGPSGCGKTTMLNIIGGLDQYTKGDLVINGKSTKDFNDRDWDAYRNHSVGFVFQSYNLIPHQSVLQNVEIALSLSGVPKAERRKRAKQALEQVGLGTQLNKKPGEMSGGQMQRVAIARAIVNDPDIILADEPTGALDSETSVQVMDILKELSKDRLVVMVTHNPELAEKYSTRIVRMLDGVITSDSAPMTKQELEKELMQEKATTKNKKEKKPSMSFATSFGLSLKNLFTKKGRTALTAFAGSIGIIGIALIFAVSQGMTMYIDAVQEDTLSSYPLILEAKHVDLGTLMETFLNAAKSDDAHELDAVYQKPVVYDLVNAMNNIDAKENDLRSFKAFLEREKADEESETRLNEAVSGIQYTYDTDLIIYTKSVDGKIILSDMQKLMQDLLAKYFGASMSDMASMSSASPMSSMMSTGNSGARVWQEMIPGDNGRLVSELLEKQYDLVYGSWPTEYNEIVLVLDSNNELGDMSLYALGLTSAEEMDAIADAAFNKKSIEFERKSWSYEQICDMEFRTVLSSDCYTLDEKTGTYTDLRETTAGVKYLYDNGLKLKVSGIIKPNETAVSTVLTGSIGYTSKLTEYIIENTKNSDALNAQLDDPTTDIFTALPFRESVENISAEAKQQAFKEYIAAADTQGKADAYVKIMSIPTEQQINESLAMMMGNLTNEDIRANMIAALSAQTGMASEQIESYISAMSDEELKEMFTEMATEQIKAQYAAGVKQQMSTMTADQLAMALDMAIDAYTAEQCALYHDSVLEFSDSDYETNLRALGYVDIDEPSSINIYAASFAEKDLIEEAIAMYNEDLDELDRITYTDYVGLMMSSVTTIINAITYVLVAFVAVSLIVSSIMIGVITLISVQERTKEIGILRAIGASKRNVSSMFNAETVIIGFTSGLLGVVITYLLCIPINMILHALTGIANLSAYLPLPVAVTLVIISVLLTLISGIIPSRSAAKKDPVVALRTE